MIKRTASKYSNSQEPLIESSFKGTKGIDGSKSPVETEYVLNSKNLDVDYDGGLVLRKPIKIKETYGEDILHVAYMYDKETLIKLSENRIQFSSKDISIEKFICTDIYGVRHTIALPEASLFNYVNASIINTVDTTIITGVLVYPTWFNDTTKITAFNTNVDTQRAYRMLKLYEQDGDWCLEMLTPEPTSMTGGEIPLDFNTALDYPLAVQDDYFSSITSLKGILAYRLPDLKVSTFSESYDDKYDINNANNTGGTGDKNLLKDWKVPGYDLKFWTYYNNNRTPGGSLANKMIFNAYNVLECMLQHLFIDIEICASGSTEALTYRWHILKDGVFTKTFEIEDFAPRDYFKITYINYSYFDAEDFNFSIDNLTESKNVDMVSSVSENFKYNEVFVLKAFLDRPDAMYVLGSTPKKDLAIIWEQSVDGVVWEKVPKGVSDTETISVAVMDEYTPPDLKDTSIITWHKETYSLLNIPPYNRRDVKKEIDDKVVYKHSIVYRPDCIVLMPEYANITNTSYRCTLYRLKDVPTYIVENINNYPTFPREGYGDDENIVGKVIDYKIGEAVYHFQKGTFEIVKNDFKNPIQHKMLYWKKSLYAYGGSLRNNIYASEIDSAIFPMSRIIDLGTMQNSTVNSLVSWKDYLIAFTDSSIHLIQEQEVGFTSKILNTFTGVSEYDAKTCVSVLNGLIFKSDAKVFMLLPNFNSGSDTIFNIAEISKPINHILEKLPTSDYKPFAFTTSEYYYLFIPYEDNTISFKYDYSRKIWVYHEYPVRLTDYTFVNNTEVRLFGTSTISVDEYGYKQFVIKEYYFNIEPNPNDDYGDTVGIDENGEDVSQPIAFFVDSGQKSTNLSLTKQFVESKIIVATLTPKDSFKMDVRIDIEGNAFTRHIDLNTSGALLRDSSNQILTLGTDMDYADCEDTFNTIRQMFLRYAGKGKTIRHIISGTSLHKFKIYEVFYRFKLPNVKQ